MIYTLSDLFKTSSEESSKFALIEGSKRMTYSNLREQILSFASLLKHKGAGKGDRRIGIFLPRSIDTVIALFATWLNGSVGVIINDVLKTKQVDYIIDNSGLNLIVTNRALVSNINLELLKSDKIVYVDKIHDRVQPDDFPQVIGSDLALIIYTSGSTGMPKGIMLSHTNLLEGVTIVADYLK